MYQVFTLDQKPHLREQIDRLSAASWPEFLLHGDMRHWHRLFDHFAPYQLLFCEGDDQVLAVGHTVPLAWNGTLEDLPATIDDIVVRAGAPGPSGGSANTLSALAAMIPRSHRGRGLSTALLESMKTVARRYGLTSFIAPVRPTGKSRYPLTPFDRYVRWARADGLPLDPWIRTHWKMGARPLKVMSQAVTVTGPVAEWETWTGLNLPETGEYVVEGAFQPVRVDVARNEGRYEEPNYWMQHPV